LRIKLEQEAAAEAERLRAESLRIAIIAGIVGGILVLIGGIAGFLAFLLKKKCVE